MSDIDDAVLEDLDLETDDEDDEAAEDDSSEFNPLDPIGVFSSGGPFGIFNRNGGRRTSTAPNRSYYQPQMQSPFVTQPQFSTALNKVRADVTKNAEAIKTVDVRVAATAFGGGRLSRHLKKPSAPLTGSAGSAPIAAAIRRR